MSKVHARVQAAAEQRKNQDLIDKMSKTGELDPSSFKEVTRGLKLPNDPYFDIMEKFYKDTTESYGGLVYQFGTMIQDALNSDTSGNLKTNKRLETLINSVNLDYGSFCKRFESIYERHKGRTGPCTTQDQVLEIFSIQAEYQDAVSVLNTNMPPAMTEAQEIVSNQLSENLKESEKQKEQEQMLDPNVTSDIEFKEVK